VFVQLTIVLLAGMAGPLLSAGPRGLIPRVVGELTAGVVLGVTGIGVIDATAQPLSSFRALGFAMLMLSAGTHVDISSPNIRQGFRRGVVAFVAVIVTAVPLALAIDHGLGLNQFPLLAVLIAGSSGAIAFPMIDERNLSGRNIAFLIAWVAIADSVTVVALPLTLSSSSSIGGALGGDAAIIAVGVVVLLVLRRVRKTPPSKELIRRSIKRGWALQVRLSMLLLLGLAAIAERTGASTLVAGFLAGMILVRLREPGRLQLQLTGLANGFFVPVFFVLLGAQLNLRSMVSAPSSMLLAFLLAAAAVVTHVVAARLRADERYVATGLAASAQLGLPAAAASLGLTLHVLSPATAAAIVAAGCLTLVPATVGVVWLARDPRAPKRDQ
jgi:Kef-type K+ transport system membrane component KefB